MEKVLKLRPTNIDYLLTMATLYEEANKITLAQKYYTKVLEIDPGNALESHLGLHDREQFLTQNWQGYSP